MAEMSVESQSLIPSVDVGIDLTHSDAVLKNKKVGSSIFFFLMKFDCFRKLFFGFF